MQCHMCTDTKVRTAGPCEAHLQATAIYRILRIVFYAQVHAVEGDRLGRIARHANDDAVGQVLQVSSRSQTPEDLRAQRLGWPPACA